MDCIRRSGQFYEIYDGTNIFCVREFLKKDETNLLYTNLVLCKNAPLDKMFVDHYFKLKLYPNKLFQTHPDTLDYVLQIYPEYLEEILRYIEEESYFYHIVRNYKPCYKYAAHNVARFGTPEILQIFLNGLSEDCNIDWFVNTWFGDVFAYGNIRLFETCRPFIHRSINMSSLIDIVNVNHDHDHLPFIQLAIQHEIIEDFHINVFARRTTDPEICGLLYHHCMRVGGIGRIIDLIMKTGNKYFFDKLLSSQVFMEDSDNHIQSWLNSCIRIGHRSILVKHVFSMYDHGRVRYRASWLETCPIQKRLNFAHMWRYIYDTHGERAFLIIYNKLKNKMIMPIFKEIIKWYPKYYDLKIFDIN